jgi:hypothetical protein
MEKSITLNLPYNLEAQEWEKISLVYQEMDGWIEGYEFPYWFGTEKDESYICASVEPSGLVMFGNVSDEIWVGWITKLCAKLTLALGKEIYDAQI